MKKIILKFIKLYQNLISPILDHHCRFYPSCSKYYCLALEKYGAIKGTWRGMKRIARCHPWNQGGIDLP